MVTKKLFNSREEWLQGRKNHIGGSDAAACVGLNPYKDNVQLWEEKVGLVLPEDISDKDYVQYGTEAEKYLRALFALDHPEYKVLYDPDNMFTNSKYPWMHASLDGELLDSTGRHGILEIKSTNILQSSQWEKWRDKIPDNYYCQVLHYLAVTEYDFVVLKAQLKSWYGEEMRLETIERFIEREEVEDDISFLIDAERRLWNCVVTGTSPNRVLPPLQ